MSMGAQGKMEKRSKGPRTPPPPPPPDDYQNTSENISGRGSSLNIQDVSPYALNSLRTPPQRSSLSSNQTPSSGVRQLETKLPLQCSHCDAVITTIQLVHNPDDVNDLRIVCPNCNRTVVQKVVETKAIVEPRTPSFSRSPSKRMRMDESLQHFGNYVLSTLREMSPGQNRNTQREIINVLLSHPFEDVDEKL